MTVDIACVGGAHAERENHMKQREPVGGAQEGEMMLQILLQVCPFFPCSLPHQVPALLLITYQRLRRRLRFWAIHCSSPKWEGAVALRRDDSAV